MKALKFYTKTRQYCHFRVLVIAAMGIFTFGFNKQAMAQHHQGQMVRLAKIQVDKAQLVQYNSALKEQMSAAVRLEPGVLVYYAVADKNDPSHITILEIYADTAAYQVHITTAHFKKYKETVARMVTKLELADVNLIASAKKPGM